MAGRSTGVHAVVWRAHEAPPDLARALTQQRITWEEAAGPFDALSRVLAARSASGRSRVLLLVEPDTLGGAEDIRAALERFDPTTGCWTYRADASPRLAPLAHPPKPAEPEIVVKPRTAAAQRPALRLTDEPAPGAAPGAPTRGQAPDREPADGGREASEKPLRGQDEPESPRSILTPEELAMLLADDPR